MGVDPGAIGRWRAHLEEVIGVDDAARVIDPFASVDWRQLHVDVAELKTDVAELKTDVAGLKTDVAGLKTGMVDLRDDMKELRGDMKELRRDLLRVTGAQFFALIAAVAAIVGLG
jgi:hypothetical protein